MKQINYYLKRPIEKICYGLSKIIYRYNAKKYFDFIVKGDEHLLEESAIIVPNHCICFDGGLITANIKKQIHHLVQYENVYNSKLRRFWWSTGQIPVKVDKRSSNKAVLKRSENYLKKTKDYIGIFSEGPTKELIDEKGKPIKIKDRKHYHSASLLAIKNKKKIIPIGISVPEGIDEILWSFGTWGFSKIDYLKERAIKNKKKIPYCINIGSPISPPIGIEECNSTKRKEEVKKLTEIVKNELCRLTEENKKLF